MRFPVAVVAFVVTVAPWGYGVAFTGFAIWWTILPTTKAVPWAVVLALFPVGLLLLAVAPWGGRLATNLNRRTAKALLSPSPSEARVAALEASRRTLVTESGDTSRHIARDLHDGPQSQLVTLAMTLALLDDQIETAPGAVHDPHPRDLLQRARALTEETLRDLRRLTAGLSPGALDRGLAPAIQELAGRSPMPVDTTIMLEAPPSPQVARAIYLASSALLANVARHSQATAVSLELTADDARVHLQVTDDGTGGAEPTPGSGLDELTHRISALDGTVTVTSPHGGPTTIDIRLPANL